MIDEMPTLISWHFFYALCQQNKKKGMYIDENA